MGIEILTNTPLTIRVRCGRTNSRDTCRGFCLEGKRMHVSLFFQILSLPMIHWYTHRGSFFDSINRIILVKTFRLDIGRTEGASDHCSHLNIVALERVMLDPVQKQKILLVWKCIPVGLYAYIDWIIFLPKGCSAHGVRNWSVLCRFFRYISAERRTRHHVWNRSRRPVLLAILAFISHIPIMSSMLVRRYCSASVREMGNSLATENTETGPHKLGALCFGEDCDFSVWWFLWRSLRFLDESM